MMCFKWFLVKNAKAEVNVDVMLSAEVSEHDETQV